MNRYEPARGLTDRIPIPGIAGIDVPRNWLNDGTRSLRRGDNLLPGIGYRAAIRGLEILGYAPGRRDDQSKDKERTDVEPGIPLTRRTKANENRRQTLSPGSRYTPPVVAKERPHKSDDGKYNEIGPVNRQAAQRADDSGPETRNQGRRASGADPRFHQQNLKKFGEPNFFLFHHRASPPFTQKHWWSYVI